MPQLFYRIGLTVALNPLTTIIATIFLTSFVIGGVGFTVLDNGYENWYPQKVRPRTNGRLNHPVARSEATS